jgi:hypothetical protein
VGGGRAHCHPVGENSEIFYFRGEVGGWAGGRWGGSVNPRLRKSRAVADNRDRARDEKPEARREARRRGIGGSFLPPRAASAPPLRACQTSPPSWKLIHGSRSFNLAEPNGGDAPRYRSPQTAQLRFHVRTESVYNVSRSPPPRLSVYILLISSQFAM